MLAQLIQRERKEFARRGGKGNLEQARDHGWIRWAVYSH